MKEKEAKEIIDKVVDVVRNLLPEVKTVDEWKKFPKETILPILTPLHIPMIQSVGLVYGHRIDLDTAKLLHDVFSKKSLHWLGSSWFSVMGMTLDLPTVLAGLGAFDVYINSQYKGVGIARRASMKITEEIGKAAIDYFEKIPGGMLEEVSHKTGQKLDKEPVQLEIQKEVQLLEPPPVPHSPQITAYKQAKEKRQQAEEEEKQAAEDIKTLVSTCNADTDGISTLYEAWQLEIDDNKAVRERLKQLYQDRMPEDATPWFQVITRKKEIKSGERKEYKYLQIGWSKTVGRDEEGDPITEEGSIQLGNLSQYISWEETIKANPQKNTPIEKY